MTIDDAIRKRIEEILIEKKISLTNLCLISNITPSTIFDFMYKKTKCPKAITIKKICVGAGMTLQEFFNREYFDSTDDVY